MAVHHPSRELGGSLLVAVRSRLVAVRSLLVAAQLQAQRVLVLGSAIAFRTSVESGNETFFVESENESESAIVSAASVVTASGSVFSSGSGCDSCAHDSEISSDLYGYGFCYGFST